MLNRSFFLVTWLVSLFNPPPLASMSLGQKIGRAFLLTLTLVAGCILTAMLAALGIFVVQRGRAMLGGNAELLAGLKIIFAGACVNAICVAVLLQIRKAERRLMERSSRT